MTSSLSARTPILTGTTASGKTALSLRIAREFEEQTGKTLELINADSLLFYRSLDIGTAKPSPAEQAQTPHHGLDLCDPGECFTAADFRAFALQKIQEIEARGHRALIVGGTGFYLKALLFGLWDAPQADPTLRDALATREVGALYEELLTRDETAARKIGPQDRYRLTRALEILHLTGKKPSELEQAARATPMDGAFELFWIDRAAGELDARIRLRAKEMLRQDFLKEVQQALARCPESPELKSVGYRQAVTFLRGETVPGRKIRPGLLGLEDEITLGTRQLAKSQRTFFAGLRKEILARTPAGHPLAVHAFTLPDGEDALVRQILSCP